MCFLGLVSIESIVVDDGTLISKMTNLSQDAQDSRMGRLVVSSKTQNLFRYDMGSAV